MTPARSNVAIASVDHLPVSTSVKPVFEVLNLLRASVDSNLNKIVDTSSRVTGLSGMISPV